VDKGTVNGVVLRATYSTFKWIKKCVFIIPAVTDSMERSFSWNGDSRSDDQENTLH